MYVCMYVHMYICTYVRMYVCNTYIRTYVSECACMRACVPTYVVAFSKRIFSTYDTQLKDTKPTAAKRSSRTIEQL